MAIIPKSVGMAIIPQGIVVAVVTEGVGVATIKYTSRRTLLIKEYTIIQLDRRAIIAYIISSRGYSIGFDYIAISIRISSLVICMSVLCHT